MAMFQFRLRSLLFVTLLVAVGLARQVHESRRQRALVESLQAKGARIAFSSDTTNLPQWLDTGYASRITSVHFNSSGVNDLSPLAGLKNLEKLWLVGTQVNDLSPLAGLNNLETLWLPGNQVSDLSPLAGLKNLKSLALGLTQVSDFSPLAELENLEKLWLQGGERPLAAGGAQEPREA